MGREKMKVIPPGEEPGGRTAFKRFDNLMRRLLTVSKKELDRRIDLDERKGKPGGRKRRKRRENKT